MEDHSLSLDMIEVMKTSPNATLPTRAHPDDAGMDLYGLEDIRLEPGQGVVTRTGIALAIPAGHTGLVADRSSMAKRGIKTAGGVIDAGYRGEVHIVLWNISREVQELKQGERIAQMLVVPVRTPAVKEVRKLTETARGAKGFGSSGK
jgi:dUTP pyrophosphatase